MPNYSRRVDGMTFFYSRKQKVLIKLENIYISFMVIIIPKMGKIGELNAKLNENPPSKTIIIVTNPFYRIT